MKLGPYELGYNDTNQGIYTGDAKLLCEELPDESIDLIFTDPPYPHEFLPLYSWLSKEAARVLKPGCLCLAYAGKTAFPEVVARLSEHLDYYWLFDIYEPGTGASLWGWHLWGNHRPILAYSKGTRAPGRWFHDAIRGHGRDKRFHKWGQSQKDAEYYIYSITSGNDIVLDPLCGGGTTPATCKILSHPYLAFEIEPQTATIARQRLIQTPIPLPLSTPTQPNLL